MALILTIYFTQLRRGVGLSPMYTQTRGSLGCGSGSWGKVPDATVDLIDSNRAVAAFLLLSSGVDCTHIPCTISGFPILAPAGAGSCTTSDTFHFALSRMPKIVWAIKTCSNVTGNTSIVARCPAN